jgi:protein-tyrosine phosphatase
MNRVLFLCSGNYYRSRFAEIVFNWHAEQEGRPWRAESRGLALDPRNPGSISSHTIEHLRKRGISSSNCLRLPMAVCDDDFAAARVVVAVKDVEHRPIIESRFAKWILRVEYWNVHDIDCAPPREAIPQLEQLTIALLHRLADDSARSETLHAGRRLFLSGCHRFRPRQALAAVFHR